METVKDTQAYLHVVIYRQIHQGSDVIKLTRQKGMPCKSTTYMQHTGEQLAINQIKDCCWNSHKIIAVEVKEDTKQDFINEIVK